jgi:hypothetical protein
MSLNLDRLSYGCQYSQCQPARSFGGMVCGPNRLYNAEFVPTESRDDISLAEAIFQSLCYHEQQFVSNRMPQGVINYFKIVQIQAEHCDLIFWTGFDPSNGFSHIFVEK